MKAENYYCSDDGEMADVIIQAQKKMITEVSIALNDYDYPVDDNTVRNAVIELCRVTLLGVPDVELDSSILPDEDQMPL